MPSQTGKLRLKDLEVAFAAPFQLALVCPPVGGAAGVLSWYERLCLAYPYGKLGTDAETPLMRALVAIELPAAVDGVQDTGPAAALRACGELTEDAAMHCLSVPTAVTADVASPVHATRSAAVNVCSATITAHVQSQHALSTIYNVGTARVNTFGERLAVLQAHANKVLKEYPDQYGGDIVWWTVGGAPMRVDVYRVQVKLGMRALYPKATIDICRAIKAGWTNTVAHVFRLAAGIEVVHHPVLLTTRPMTPAAVGAATAQQVAVWGQQDMAPLWPAFIREFASVARLAEFLVVEEEEEVAVEVAEEEEG